MTDLQHRFKWITAHEAFKTWTNSQNPSILHIHGSNDTSDASKCILRYLDMDRKAEQKKEIITYFTFTKDDDRYSSITAMLITLLVQVFSQCPHLYNTVRLPFDEMCRHSCWTQTDLLLLFRRMLSSHEHGGIVCVINSMNAKIQVSHFWKIFVASPGVLSGSSKSLSSALPIATSNQCLLTGQISTSTIIKRLLISLTGL